MTTFVPKEKKKQTIQIPRSVVLEPMPDGVFTPQLTHAMLQGWIAEYVLIYKQIVVIV